jgi:hypothetical protein
MAFPNSDPNNHLTQYTPQTREAQRRTIKRLDNQYHQSALHGGPGNGIKDLKLMHTLCRRAALTFLILAASLQVFGQAPGYQPPTTPAPRRPDGKVDFSANWAPNAIRQNINLASVGGEPPMLPWAEKVYKERKDNISKDDPEARCLPPGVPRMSTTPYPGPWCKPTN